MSPVGLRRYRAERLLRAQFEELRAAVLRRVRVRLRSCGAGLDGADLDACYAQAWQGLFAKLLDGAEIENPSAWLVLVTFRRAIEEHRSRSRLPAPVAVGCAADADPAYEHDVAGELDDRALLRSVFEGLRLRLTAREREAAVLCYLQGLPRAQAAARMGISEARMRKLMEGLGPERPGVARKVRELLETVRRGAWCEEQSSLMRGLAFGMLDPHGERYRLAQLHRGECTACRAYVLSLRGLAAALPPVFAPRGLIALALSGRGARAGLAAAGRGAGAARSGGQAAGGRAVGGKGAGRAPGAKGGGGFRASSSARGVAGKLATGVLALGAGAGCVALGVGAGSPAARHGPLGHPPPLPAASRPVLLPVRSRAGWPGRARDGAAARFTGDARRRRVGPRLGGAGRGDREFSPEQPVRQLAPPPPPLAPAAAAPPAGGAEREFAPG